MTRAKIIATGKYLPKKIATNEDFVKEFGNDTSPRALKRLLGTDQHYVADENEMCADLLLKAANDILERIDLEPKDLSRIIVSTTPGDYIEPATFVQVHHNLKAECPAIEIKASCVGWLSGVDVAMQYLANVENHNEKILVIAAALMSKTIPVRLVQHRAIFADGAGGILVGRTPKDEASCIYGSEFIVLGEYTDIIRWPASWSHHPDSIPEEFNGYFYMGESKILFKLIQDNIKLVLSKLWKKTGFRPEDVDFAVIHQPTEPLFKEAVKNSGIDPSKIAENFAQYGNTVSAELPITLHDAVQEGRVKRGDLVLLITYGAGITGGAMLLRY